MTDVPEKLPLTSADIAAEKHEQLRRCLAATFPEIMAEDKIDLDQLRRVLGEWVEPDRERFGLNWPGKAACMKVIQAPSVGTLKPSRAESVDWDTTGNIFIEGDNLEVLKLLQKAYFGKIKMIYIDPPYNTGGDFIYPDNYAENLDTYLEYTGQKDREGRKFSTNTDSSGRFHSRWLNMIYPRLYLAKSLLSDDGVIFISIDDGECQNLRKICDEIFGEENFIANMIWESAGKNDARQIGINHEYILVFAKNRNSTRREWSIAKVGVEPIFSEVNRLRKKFGDDFDAASEAMANWYKANKSTPAYAHRRYRYIDRNGLYKEENPTAPGGRKFDLKNPMTGETIKLTKGRGWSFDQAQFDDLVRQGRISFISSDSIMLRLYLHETDAVTPQSVFYQPTRSASERLSKFLGGTYFDFPKDESIIQQLVEMTVDKDDDIVLDFFAGSATTGHSVILESIERKRKLHYILVQLPEPCEENSPAAREGFKTISDIGKERLRRVARTVAQQNVDRLRFKTECKPDLGFKVFKLDRSNFRPWEGAVTEEAQLDAQLELHIEHVAAASSAEDILYELLLKDGFPLATPIAKLVLADKDVFSVAGGALLICLDKQLTQEVIDAMADREPSRVICLDAGFQGNDQLKANAVQTFKARARNRETALEFRTV